MCSRRRSPWITFRPIHLPSPSGPRTLGRGFHAYDYAGLRLSKEGPTGDAGYLWAEGELLEETLPGRTVLYQHGAGLAVAAGPERLMHDALGSIAGRVGGTSRTTVRFDAWGAFRSGAEPGMGDPSRAYAGQHWDADLGLSYAQQRWYDARSGRFLSEDPVGATDDRLREPVGLHAFGYGNGNPIIFRDPDGRASRQQFKEAMVAALKAMSSGNQVAKGRAGELVLENLLHRAGYTIIKGPATNAGAHYADVVAYDPSSRELLFFDNKVMAEKATVSRADAFSPSRRSGVIADAQAKFQDIMHTFPEEQVDDIRQALRGAAENPEAAKFLVSNASPAQVENLVSRVSKRLVRRGIRFVDASRGSKRLRGAIDEVLVKEAGEVAGKLKLAKKLGKKVAKAVPALGTGASLLAAVPRVAAAAEDDLAYEEMMRSMGEEPRLKGFSLAREMTIIAGEEAGGEAGGWGGAALGGALTLETGPGVIVGAVGGAIICGVAGDSAGGWIAEKMFDSGADDLYEQHVGGVQPAAESIPISP